MKFKLYKFALLTLMAVVFTACNWLNTTEETTSSSGQFVSLTFAAANSEDDAVSDASFTLEKYSEYEDSVIVNIDSIAFNTAIDSVIPTFSFASVSKTYVFRNDSNGVFQDSILLTGTDTLDFNRVFKIVNYASDGVTRYSYHIQVNVHTVEPELYQWTKMTSNLYNHSGSIQKAVYFNDEIYFYVSTGLNTSLYKSTDGAIWSDKISVSKLPDNAQIKNIVCFNNKMYLIHNESILYSSEDGIDWTATSLAAYDFNFKNLLYDFKNQLWALVQSKTDDKYRFATTTDGSNWTMQSVVIDNNFPVGDFAAVSFLSRTNQPRVVIAGGYNKDGALMNRVWSSEDGLYWVDFARENLTYGKRAGASMVYYEDKLLVFGGVDDSHDMLTNLFIQSGDEGLSWKKADTLMLVREKYWTKNKNDLDSIAYIKWPL